MYGLASRLGENIPGWRGKAGGGGVALEKKIGSAVVKSFQSIRLGSKTTKLCPGRAALLRGRERIKHKQLLSQLLTDSLALATAMPGGFEDSQLEQQTVTRSTGVRLGQQTRSSRCKRLLGRIGGAAQVTRSRRVPGRKARGCIALFASAAGVGA